MRHFDIKIEGKYAQVGNDTRAAIWGKTRDVCVYCGVHMLHLVKASHPKRYTIDHFVPKSHGGTNHVNNLLPCCFKCNHAKGNKPPLAYLGWAKYQQILRDYANTDQVRGVRSLADVG